MRVISWNVNSLNVRLNQIRNLLQELKPDFLLLQETKIEKVSPNLFSDLKYRIYHSGGKGRNGVAIITPFEAERTWIGFEEIDAEDNQAKERLIGGKFGELYVFSVYVPNGSPVDSDYFFYKLQFLSQLRDFLEKNFNPRDKLILGGDFNVAPEDIDVYDPLLLEGHICFTKKEKNAFKYLLSWGLLDGLRFKYPDKKGLFTWWDYQYSAFKRNLGMRLDHLLFTMPLSNKLKDIWVDLKWRALPKPSDHAPLIADFED